MQQRRQKRKEPEEPVKLDWRVLALILVPLVFACVGMAIYVTVINGPKSLTEADRAMLRDYDVIRAALFHDDLAAAQRASEAFVQRNGNSTAFSAHAASVAKAISLDRARAAFSQMSEEATKLAFRHSEYFNMGCSMDRCPVKCSPCQMKHYANWVQLTPEVENPYMGQASPHCGIVKLW